MIITSQSGSNRTGSVGKGLLIGLCLFMAGALQTAAAQVSTLPKAPSIMPASASTESVPVDQQPLTIRKPIPPNIMLMLDDSGSMSYDYMPDWSYLDTSDDALRNSQNNGTYYNPNVDYSPPPKADGDSYPDSPGLGNAYKDGFTDRDSDDEIDVTQYTGSYKYYTKFTADVPASYDASPGCKDGDDTVRGGSHDGDCEHLDGTKTSYYNPHDGGWFGPYCNRGDHLVWHNHRQKCRHRERTYSYYSPSDDYPVCPKGGRYDPDQKECVTDKEETAYVFTYITKDTDGNYVPHYVAKTKGDCATVNAASSGADCVYDADARQNVANWFSYYRTRILMAKSGLMNAFFDLNSTYRFGFGSLHNNGGFPSGVDTVTKAGHKLAVVEPFGDGSSSTDQKSKFWDWIVDANPKNGTPLRTSLKSIGEYYQTSGPWESTNKTTGKTETLACRQSYAIVTTDGFWNGESPDVGDADDSKGDKIKGPNGESYQYNPTPPYSGDYHESSDHDKYGTPVTSNTLADVAMYYWNHDLQGDVSNEVPTNGSDPAFWQHMVTFTIGLGFTPKNINPDGTSINDIFKWANGGSKYKISNFSWPEPSAPSKSYYQGNSGTIDNIADLAHAAVNGHGGFYSATNPQSFASGLKSALDRASERTGSGASLAANSTELKTGVMAYQAIYHTAIWTGELNAFKVNPSNGEIITPAQWNAASQMPAAANRDIYTYNPDATSLANRGYVAFKDDGSATPRTPPNLSSKELTALGSDTAAQANMVDYLRGDSAQEQRKNGAFRNRTNGILGDIVDSQPVYVGSVDANEFVDSTFTGSDTFSTFASNKKDRGGRIYVAANDGMLHAFDADTGAETYAYLPGAVITAGGISKIADPGYGTADDPHQYFNDGQLTVADAYFKGPGNSTAEWHSVLVGTTGRGAAKAIYALDVTDPDSIKFLWERSAGDGKTNSDYIGQMTGKPIVAQIADGTKSKWVVLMGNGYNSSKDEAALLQFDLSDGDLEAYATNSDTGNGLAAPAVWVGDKSNGLSTMAYAGDLKGHVWEFQLGSTSGPALGGSSTSSSPVPAPDNSGTLLFTATDGTNAQPITGGMLVGRNPDTSDLWLFFGTGRYLSSDDLTDTQVQTWYGIIVQSSNTSLVSNLKKDGRDALAQRKIVAQFPGSTTKNADGSTTVTLPTRIVSLPHEKDSDTPSITGKSGWYMNLESPTMNAKGEVTGYNQEGERMVTANQFQGSLLVGTTRIPKSTDVCNPSGTGWIMAIDPFTGTNPYPSFFDINGDGSINSDDSKDFKGNATPVAGVGFGSQPNNPIFVGGDMLTSFSNGSTSTIMTSGSGNNLERVSWREMVNP